MKAISTFLLLLLTTIAFANPDKVYDRLCEVNKCWKQQTDVAQLIYPEYTDKTDREWIRVHLQLVEKTLRARSTGHLSESQKANRISALDHLNEYWHTGAFPINDKYAYRTPIFIDDYDNFCAVGYLVKATGQEQVSRKIAAKTNLAYVHDMDYPELFAWANVYGFTVDELAWIQPSYGPPNNIKPVGGGTDGTVYELHTSSDGNRLYVGGNFDTVDNSINANSIAYVTESSGVYTWHKMGDGINGQVNSIIEFDSKVFVGGSFDSAGKKAIANVAYWDGSDWQSPGCIYGSINDFAVFNNKLYAVGSFDVCAALADINFAYWDTTYNIWQQIPGLSGHINTIEIVNSEVFLGGKFVYLNDTLTAIKWDPTNSFTKFSTAPEHEVTDFVYFKNSIVASSKLLDTNSTDTLLRKLVNNKWEAVSYQPFYQLLNREHIPQYNTLLIDNDSILIGGLFVHGSPNFMALNCRSYTPEQ